MINKNEFVKRNQTWIETAQNLQEAIQNRRYWEEQEQHFSHILRILSEGKASIGGGFIYDKITRKGNIDYNAIPVLKEIDLEQYRKQDIEMWKLTLELTLSDGN